MMIVFIVLTSFGQIVAPNTYLIKFKDKNNSPYSVDKPEEFLSQRAIDRRLKFNIPVTLQDIPVNESYIQELKDLGFEIYAVSKWMNHAIVYSEDSTLISQAHTLDFVTTEIPFKNRDKKTEVKNGEKLNILTTPDETFKFDYGKGKNQITMLNVHRLHNQGFTGKGIVMAILDAGFYNTDSLKGFDSIRTNNQILGTRDFVERDGDVYDDGAHGMQVLSTIAANLPGKLIGSAPDAEFWLLRSEDDRSENIVEEYYWAAAAEFADSVGADMIHSSLGYNNFDKSSSEFNHTYEDMNGDIAPATIASDIASSKGILVVTSAGNEGNDPWKYVTSPADADSTLTVGSTLDNGTASYFSSKGPSADGRIKPDVMAQGSFIYVLGRSRGVTFSFGTSFSAPLMAGAVACLWQANPEFTNLEIIEAVQKSSDRYHKPDETYGYGIPNFYIANKYLKQKKSEEGS